MKELMRGYLKERDKREDEYNELVHENDHLSKTGSEVWKAKNELQDQLTRLQQQHNELQFKFANLQEQHQQCDGIKKEGEQLALVQKELTKERNRVVELHHQANKQAGTG